MFPQHLERVGGAALMLGQNVYTYFFKFLDKRHTSLLIQQVLLLAVVSHLRWFDLRGELRVDVMTITDVVHPAAAARDDPLNLLRGVVHLRRLVPVCKPRGNINKQQRYCSVLFETTPLVCLTLIL